MNVSRTGLRRGKTGLAALAILVVLGIGGGATAFYLLRHQPGDKPSTPSDGATKEDPAKTAEEQKELADNIHSFCSRCHAYPPADSFPKKYWRGEVERGFNFFNEANLDLDRPAPYIEDVVAYYEAQAPQEITLPDLSPTKRPLPCRFSQITYPEPTSDEFPAISSVNVVSLFGSTKKQHDILATDMRRGWVLALKPYEANPSWKILYRGSPEEKFNPAHTEVVDLDQDGKKDILVANLASFPPTNSLNGSVLWLRNRGKINGEDRFEPITLLKDVGRVSDVQAGDFNGDGKIDLIVAVFGWTKVGEILYLENQTTDWDHPKFKTHRLDTRHGAIHVPVTDLDGDGNLDFVALLSQEHETIVAFLGDGKGGFTKRQLYKAPHPGYGSSGIQLVDLNGDGKIDVLYTNGDVLDGPSFYKPHHSVRWLENKGNLQFEHHHIATLYGVHRAIAADFDGDGDLDILATSFLPAQGFTNREKDQVDAVILLEQTAPGKFERHSLEKGSCDYVSCAAGDLFGSGRMDVVLGRFSMGGLGKSQESHSLLLWKNNPPLAEKGKRAVSREPNRPAK